MARNALSPLQSLEKFLAVRLHALELRLPPDGKDSADWLEYREVGKTLVEVRKQLYPPREPRR